MSQIYFMQLHVGCYPIQLLLNEPLVISKQKFKLRVLKLRFLFQMTFFKGFVGVNLQVTLLLRPFMYFKPRHSNLNSLDRFIFVFSGFSYLSGISSIFLSLFLKLDNKLKLSPKTKYFHPSQFLSGYLCSDVSQSAQGSKNSDTKCCMMLCG